jgi:3-hydroxyisobutyrate dehydrogenase
LDAVIDGISEHDRAGQIVIECSTLTVDQKIAAHGRLAEAGKNMLDSPISATPAMLAKMMASIHISGDEAAYQECIAVFEGFTASNFYVGPVGNGSRMKILANYLVHVNTTAAAECMALGQKAGLDPDMIYEVLCKSAGTSKMFEIRGAMMAKSDYREGGGTMFAIYEKDSSIITEFAAQMKSPIDLYVSSRQKMNSAMALGLGHLDTSAVCKAIEVAAGIDRKLVE